MRNIDRFPYSICWDLDHTLLALDCITEENQAVLGRGHRLYQPVIARRHGIQETLQRLANQEVLHLLTTAASGAYAVPLLEQSHLIEYFAEIFDGDIVAPHFQPYKSYKPIEEIVYRDDKTETIYAHRMLAIGDHQDQPEDLEELVYIQQADGHLYDSLSVTLITDALKNYGQGSIKNGFDLLYDLAQPVKSSSDLVKSSGLLSGISMQLSYADPRAELSAQAALDKRFFPKITNIIAPNYSRQPDILHLP